MHTLRNLLLRVWGWVGGLSERVYHFVYTPACWAFCLAVSVIGLVVAIVGAVFTWLDWYGGRLFAPGILMFMVGLAVGTFALMFRFNWMADARHYPRRTRSQAQH